MQRCPIETFCALGSRHDAMVAVEDRGQEIYPAGPTGRGEVVLQTCPTFAAESLLERASAAPGAPYSPTVYHLAEAKRIGDPLATYLAHAYPKRCAALSASPELGKETPVTMSGTWRPAPAGSTWDTFWATHARNTSETHPLGKYQRPYGTMVSARSGPRAA